MILIDPPLSEVGLLRGNSLLGWEFKRVGTGDAVG